MFPGITSHVESSDLQAGSEVPRDKIFFHMHMLFIIERIAGAFQTEISSIWTPCHTSVFVKYFPRTKFSVTEFHGLPILQASSVLFLLNTSLCLNHAQYYVYISKVHSLYYH